MKPDLSRFIQAQAGQYDQALAEIRAGRKRSHWIWYIFPQLRGLGRSYNSEYYGLEGIEEATDYLSHPALGPRLIDITRALLALPGSNATAVMGSPDDLKLQSCMTLFSLVDHADPAFREVLEKYYNGVADQNTVRMLGREGDGG